MNDSTWFNNRKSSENISILLNNNIGYVFNNSSLKSFNINFGSLLFLSFLDNFHDLTGNRSFLFWDKGDWLSRSIIVKNSLIDDSIINGDNLILCSSGHNSSLNTIDWFSFDYWHHLFSNSDDTGIFLSFLDRLNSISKDSLVTIFVDRLNNFVRLDLFVDFGIVNHFRFFGLFVVDN